MNMFSSISQALRTGEPLHEASRQNLMDRFHYHGTVATGSLAAENGESPLEAITDYNYMFYASAVVAVVHLLEVNVFGVSLSLSEIYILISLVDRVFKNSGLLPYDWSARYLWKVFQDGEMSSNERTFLYKPLLLYQTLLILDMIPKECHIDMVSSYRNNRCL